MTELVELYRLFDREDVHRAKLTHTRETADRIAGPVRGSREGTYVYAVTDGDAVKIGIAKNIDSRIKGMQTGNYRDITLLKGWFVGEERVARLAERNVHESLARLHLNGEWFKRDGFDLAAVDAVIDNLVVPEPTESPDPQNHTVCELTTCDWCEGFEVGLKRGKDHYHSAQWKPLPLDRNGKQHGDCPDECIWDAGFNLGSTIGTRAEGIIEARSSVTKTEWDQVKQELRHRVSIHNTKDPRYYRIADEGRCGCEACRTVKVVNRARRSIPSVS